jgi:hypothetical protein
MVVVQVSVRLQTRTLQTRDYEDGRLLPWRAELTPRQLAELVGGVVWDGDVERAHDASSVSQMAPSEKGTESGLLFGDRVGWQAEPAHELAQEVRGRADGAVEPLEVWGEGVIRVRGPGARDSLPIAGQKSWAVHPGRPRPRRTAG